MAKTLRQILGAKNLCGVIQAVKPGLAADILPPPMLRPTRTVEGDHCTYRKVSGTRKTAVLVHYGAPSVARSTSGVSEVAVRLLHSFEHIFHNPTTLMNLQNLADEGRQKLGQLEISRQTGEFKQLFQNLRVATIFSALILGHIYFDDEGNLLPSSSNHVVDVDYGIPAGNLNQLDILGDGAIIGASWNTAGTAIEKHMRDIITASRKLTGYRPTHCYYGSNVQGYLLGNTKLKEIINRNTALQTAFAGANEIADGFLGIKKWIPLDEAFFVDQGGTVQSMMNANKIVLTPDPSPEWWEVVEGTYPVPTDIGAISADAAGALGNVAIRPGMFSYAQVLSDPVTIKHLAGDTFLPIIKVPKAVFIGTVHF